jgi:hypothetical protein
MGLLDDAIKEHLELKRRRGADPGEVAREEHEALGPVRREVQETSAASEVDAEPVDGDQDELDAAEQATALHVPEGMDEEPPPAAPDAPVSATRRQDPDDFGFDDDEDPEEERDADSPRGEEPESEGDDVLEETPEFLQETPEHDRLWFEQKPPRDFDFDS